MFVPRVSLNYYGQPPDHPMTLSRRKSNKHAEFMRNGLSEQEEQAPVYHQHTGT